MSIEEENKAKQRRIFEEALNRGNLALFDDLIAADYEAESPQGTIKGAEGMKQGATALRTAFPDIHFTVEDMVAEEDRVVSRVTVRGTHEGEYMGIPPTGKKFAVNAIIITRWVDGKEVEAWEVVDMLGMFQQLGISPPG